LSGDEPRERSGEPGGRAERLGRGLTQFARSSCSPPGLGKVSLASEIKAKYLRGLRCIPPHPPHIPPGRVALSSSSRHSLPPPTRHAASSPLPDSTRAGSRRAWACHQPRRTQQAGPLGQHALLLGLGVRLNRVCAQWTVRGKYTCAGGRWPISTDPSRCVTISTS
jgi:hypothetical protein